MAKQVGASIKEARVAAGMTQKQLAEAVEGLGTRDVSEVERGLKELTDEQLGALAEALGVDLASLLGDDAGEASEAGGDVVEASEAQEEPDEASVGDDAGEAQEGSGETAEAEDDADEASGAQEGVRAFLAGHEDVLNLFNSAVPAAKEAALSVLKGETEEQKDLLGGVLPAAAGVLGNIKDGENPILAIVGFLGSKDGEALLETVKKVLGNVADVFGAVGAGSEDGNAARRTSNSFFAFTFFYTIAIYILLMAFHFIQAQLEAKPEEQ